MVKENIEMGRGIGDPSANVQLLVGNAVKYLEELHKSAEENFNNKLQAFIESSRREDTAESDRINELRKGDLESVRVANVQAIKTAELLASQMLENAEVLRKSVELTASQLASQLEKITGQQDTRFAILEKASYENKGRSGISSPLLMLLAGLGGGIIVFLIETFMKT